MRKKLTMLLASLFLMTSAVLADAPVVGQRYRLKNVTTGLYMQANGSSNLQLQEQKYSVLQFFSVEDAGDGKLYLKSESGVNKYVNASGWDAVVGSGDNKTPYTVALVSGETDVYTLDQVASSYTGKIGSDGNTAGSVLYCNKSEGDNGKWQFEAVANPVVCTFDPTKTYRIKSEYSGLYMQLMTTGTSGTTEGAFKLKEKSVVAEGQKFMFEAATGGKYYLKTVKDGTTYYVNQGSWNFHAGSEATTPFEITVVDGHTAVYSFKQTVDEWNSGLHGYAGNGNEEPSSFNDGINIYCNQSNLTGNTIWSLEEVVADPNNIVELNQLDNNSYYKLAGERGFIFGADDVVKGTNKVAQAYSEGNKDQHFAIIEKDGKYYLYNVGAKKFVVKSGNNTKLVDLPEQPITLEKTSDKNYVWSILLNGANKINLSTGYNDYGIYTDYNDEDPGNRWLIYKAGNFDPTEALAAFDKVYATVNYVLGTRETVTIKKAVTSGTTYSFGIPSYTSVVSCTAGDANNGVYSFVADGTTEATLTLEEHLPFIVSAAGAPVWHNLRIRPVRNGNEEFNWVVKSENVPYTFVSECPTTDEGLWAFTGNPVEGFQLLNKASENMTLGVNGSNVVMQSGKTTWTIGECKENGTLRGFYLYQGTDNKYAHEMGGKLQIWNDTSAPTDGGSAFVAYRPMSTSRPYYSLKSATGTYLGLTPKANGLVADGVYTITGDANGSRGYLAAGVQYTTRPILSNITYTGCEGNSVEAIENGKNWYVYTTAVGTYIYNIGKGQFLAQEWNRIQFSDVPYAWNIKENGTYTSIYDNAMAKYLSMGCGTSPSVEWEQGDPIVRFDGNANDGGAQHTFTAVAEGDYTNQIAAAQAAIAKVSVSFQETPLHLYYTLTADGATFEYKDEAGKFLGFEEDGWNVVNAQSAWTIQDADLEGYSHIVRAADATKHLGSSVNTNVGTGIYSNIETGCNKWAFEGVYENYATTATARNNKYYFTSDRLRYAGACNVLRFTLTESDGKFQSGFNRMSLDEFVLYNANGEVIHLEASDVVGNNGKTYAGMLDGVNGIYGGTATWNSGTEDDWFEITLPDGVDLGGAFSFSFVTENTGMNAKAFDIAMRYESNNYVLNIVAPYGTVVNATYNGEPIAHGGIISGGFDQTLLEIADIENFEYTVTVDGRVVTIEFVQTGAIVNPASVVALINRIGGTNTASKFKFVLDPSLNLNAETFVIGGEDGKILIKGTTISAITTGLGWYLNNIAHINIAWNSLNEKTVEVKWDANAGYADLTYLPVPTTEETHKSDAKYRYYLNTCTFGYSMTSWTWTRWQQEIDWMALHGINMPLQLVGLEEVWRKFLTMEDANGNRKYGYTDEEAKAFVAGPAFIAWWAMNNLEGWGGTAEGSKSGYNNLAGAGGVQDDAWYVRQKNLAKQIVDAQRALGMQPVIPGWSGMVPSNFATESGFATRGNGSNWAGDFVRPLLLSVSNSNYASIAADYYECLHAVMGESQYYSMDPFHEGGGVGTMEDYKALYDAMEAAKAGSQWVIQQWQWKDYQAYSLTAVPEGRLIVLDLFSDGDPDYDEFNNYEPQEAVFCAIPNFGGRSGLMGRLQNVTDNYFKFKGELDNLKGIGTAPEAIEQTPVTYDLIYQLPWMNGVKPDVAAWVDNYAVARYGKDNAVVKEAWSLLRQGPLNYGADGIQGPVEDVWAARPNLDANKASSWGVTLANAGGTYTPARRQMLIDAVYKLIDQEDELELTNSVYRSNYLYDLVEFGGAVMADYAYDLLLGIKAAKNAAGANFANDDTYKARRDAFLQLILDMDAFRGTNLNFRLGKWTQEARDAAEEVENASTATPDWYEYNNARTILTTWSSPGTNLTDYSYRSWQGLLKDYYYKRWKYYFDNNCTDGEYKYFEWNWAHGKEHYVGQTGISNVDLTAEQDGHTSKYTREPVGNTVEEAVKMLGKYIIPVAMADGTHYAYRYLTNDLSSKVTIIAVGESIDLTQYFGALEGATVTGDFIEGTATDLANISLKANLDGAYTGTITLVDGTVLTFGVTVNPQYYGAFQIKYNGSPVFIQYNEGGDNGNSVGYKVMGATGFDEYGNATSTNLIADYEADKIFTITPSGTGYTLSAQGQYLKTTASSGWAHIMFSDQKGDAGTYTFTEDAGLVKLKSSNTSGNASVAIFGNGAWGNDVDNKAKGFTFEKVENYAITIPEGGLYTVCLPFNVVLPTGVTAYDVTVAGLTSGDDGAITTLATIATEGQILKAGTPAVLKATPATYNFTITMSNTDAKTSSPESKLRGNFVKQTLQPGTGGLSKFVLVGGAFELLRAEQEIPANTCWIEAKIDAEHVEVTEHEGKVVKVDDWLFNYTDATNGIKLTDFVEVGDGNLEIKSEYTINGKKESVVAISPNFLENNKEVTSVKLPASLVNLGFRKVNPMFEGRYEGQSGDTAIYKSGTTTLVSQQGMNRCYEFPENKDTGKPYEVNEKSAWKLTLDVTIDEGNPSFNEFGSAIVSTKENSLDDDYTGYLQIYLKKNLQDIVVKIDTKLDLYTYKTFVLDEEGNETEEPWVNNHFKFEMEHDGSGGYQVVIYYDNGKAKMYNITAKEGNLVNSFNKLYYSLPEGIHVDVKFEQLTHEGLFVGCTKLTKIEVDPDNKTFSSCDHGVLYDKNGYYVMRIPEGGTDRYEIPSKVVKIYPGAVHGVQADVILHSNPQIGVVEGHEKDVENVKFHLKLVDDEKVKFDSYNLNTYRTAQYVRAPLAAGKYGTIILPFAPDKAILDEYEFFVLKGGDASGITFSQVNELKADVPYLYKLKDGAEESTENIVMSAGETTIDKTNILGYASSVENNDKEWVSVGCYSANEIITTDAKDAYYGVSGGSLVRVLNKFTTRPFRVYYMLKNGNASQTQAPARFTLRFSDGSTTEIDPSQIEGMEETIYYDLQGRRVLNPTNGVYIVNGKKVIL